ncbi:hypothetical protein CU097_008593 [Rhizopus azygosporus]|uniref:Beta,beta-carotene 15,15'-monooxygenase n=2 Tax=Rhizopus TaxID=4842 RepID=A0A367JC65_RHIAZ|nr:hypothetical protein CU097_008593 [Rhizopus azygosporus]
MALVTFLLLPGGFILYLLYKSYTQDYKKFLAMQISNCMENTLECQEPIDLKCVSGKLPIWLNGIMYRIGPGIFNIKQNNGTTYSIRHAFDGLPVVHRVVIKGDTQQVTYNSRCTANSLRENIKAGSRIGLVFFGHLPDLSFFSWIRSFLSRVDNYIIRPTPRNRSKPDGLSVAVTPTPNFPLPVRWNKDNTLSEKVLVAKTDANLLQKIHAETLVPERIFNYGTYNAELDGMFSAAHHQLDPETGEIFNFSMHLAPVARITVFKTLKDGSTTILANITRRRDSKQTRVNTPYIHSFYLTKNYVILPESPLVYKDKAVNMLLQGTAVSCMKWLENTPTYFHIIRRNLDYPGQNGHIASIPAPEFFTFHTANAFESKDPNGDTILHLDCSAFADGDIIYQVRNFGGVAVKDLEKETTKFNGFTYPPQQQVDFGDLVRHTINLPQQKLVSVDTLATNVEFPRIHQQYASKPYGFVYGCQLMFGDYSTIALVKVNMNDGPILRYCERGYSCSEPIFVPHPNSEHEDDGVLISLANHAKCCYLVVIDAKDMTEIAKFEIGEFNPLTFHGSFVDYHFKSINLS